MFKKNIGTADRMIRFILSILFFAAAFWYKSWILAIFGAFTLYEALASWCVLYQLLGKSSCSIDRKDR